MRFTSVLMLLATALLTACGDDDESGVCPAVWIPAVRMTVVNTLGVAVQDARVTFSLDGEEEEEATCTQQGQTEGSCLEWTTRNEVGRYDLHATSSDGLRSDSDEVTVTGGACGPTGTTDVQLVLPD
ncbi:hypothetical protein JY651_32500 [Pyxidicoccus parkwayensis]|uniref:Lipoprotein n=1 Tax=Pyxidicoccus parkwayensis TaxID=2813578 RepID=A0ABX7NM90_9BACT|nr:hypothetical protein [Pyxidicoccus parkwaysis]QSQ19982.1 hypothetical protein JY651_32500 [Pyxidicoccus parkwaysis]